MKNNIKNIKNNTELTFQCTYSILLLLLHFFFLLFFLLTFFLTFPHPCFPLEQF